MPKLWAMVKRAMTDPMALRTLPLDHRQCHEGRHGDAAANTKYDIGRKKVPKTSCPVKG